MYIYIDKLLMPNRILATYSTIYLKCTSNGLGNCSGPFSNTGDEESKKGTSSQLKL